MQTPTQTPTQTGATTLGTLLGGRVSYRQFRDGYRTGIEPVLLAAAVQARPGSRVLEAGCGAGAGLLCLASRLPGVHGSGIERDGPTAALARHNLDENGLPDWPIITAGIADPEVSDLARAAGRFDHAIANPPWHRATASASPLPRRDLAKRAPEGTLTSWTDALAQLLQDAGTLTMILPAASHADAVVAMSRSGFGAIRLLPLWPLPGRPARIVLVQGVLGGRGDGAVLPGLVLHQPGGGYTEAAEAILRSGSPLPLA
ncbi:tRNA1(Val) (adenine(37)-N6)-methyltransferase [Lichenicola sp.]|uniref:tRNA1(Val) (adenine(37)-N6)-methyltransferase n=1 Tax=Lichenicola sp. TaxID=2804529 RepID=UPI003B00E939